MLKNSELGLRSELPHHPLPTKEKPESFPQSLSTAFEGEIRQMQGEEAAWGVEKRYELGARKLGSGLTTGPNLLSCFEQVS